MCGTLLLLLPLILQLPVVLQLMLLQMLLALLLVTTLVLLLLHLPPIVRHLPQCCQPLKVRRHVLKQLLLPQNVSVDFCPYLSTLRTLAFKRLQLQRTLLHRCTCGPHLLQALQKRIQTIQQTATYRPDDMWCLRLHESLATKAPLRLPPARLLMPPPHPSLARHPRLLCSHVPLRIPAFLASCLIAVFVRHPTHA